MSVLRALRACGLAAVLALGAAACADAPGTTPQSTSSRPAQGPSQSPPPADVPTTKDNVAATRAFSRWLLHAVPMPPGAWEWRHSPTSHYREASIGIGPADPAFSRTTWWTVPLTGTAFEAWLRAHVRRGLTAEDGGGSVQSRGVWEHDVDFRAPSTAAHTRGWVNFSFMPGGAGVVVRVDTFVGARFARTVLVPATTTSVTILRTERSTGPHRRRHSTTRTITDPDTVARLVGLVNGLPGAMTKPFHGSCPVALSEKSYRLTFAATDHTYVADLPTTICWPEVRLSVDGTPVDPPLDPGPGFTGAVDRSLG